MDDGESSIQVFHPDAYFASLLVHYVVKYFFEFHLLSAHCQIVMPKWGRGIINGIYYSTKMFLQAQLKRIISN